MSPFEPPLGVPLPTVRLPYPLEDDPETECIEWFWASLNEDDVYDKEFLEYLMQMVEDVELGKVETYSMDEVMDKLKWADEVLEGVDLDEELPEEDT